MVTAAHGPIDFVLIEFPTDRLTGEAGPALVDLVEREVIRLLDLLVISKGADGSVEGIELTDPAPFVSAVRNSGGELIASARIPATDVIAALDALESLESATSS